MVVVVELVVVVSCWAFNADLASTTVSVVVVSSDSVEIVVLFRNIAKYTARPTTSARKPITEIPTIHFPVEGLKFSEGAFGI